jgi:hypothetical protein
MKYNVTIKKENQNITMLVEVNSFKELIDYLEDTFSEECEVRSCVIVID